MASTPIRKRHRDTEPTPVSSNWSYGPHNRYLFRDEEAFECYNTTMGIEERSVAECFYFHPFGRLENEHMRLLRSWVTFWDLRNLAGRQSPYHPRITRLFYANLRVSYDHHGVPFASSFLFGRYMSFGVKDIAEFLQTTSTLDGLSVYTHASWPRDFESRREYRRWFKLAPDVARGALSTASLPAMHRFLCMVINHILFPRDEVSDVVSSETLFYLRHLIAKDKKVNVAYLIIRHMHQSARTLHSSLPYGHLIEELMHKAGIATPDTLWGNKITDKDVEYPNNLLGELPNIGWVETSSGTLVPDPNHAVNVYIMQPGAACNQYGPLREGSPPSDGGSTTEIPRTSSAYFDQKFGEVQSRLESIEVKLETALISLDELKANTVTNL